MACCYIAASMIAFIINSCEALDINLNLQYNESVKHGGGGDYDDDYDGYSEKGGRHAVVESGVSIVSISGMTCAACTTNVEGALRQLKGVTEVLVSLALQEARIFSTRELDAQEIISAVEGVGYDATMGERAAPQKVEVLRHSKELESLRYALRGLVTFSTVIFCLGKGIDFAGLSWLFSPLPLSLSRTAALFCLTAYTAGRHGRWIFAAALSAASQAQVNMHTLISASTLVGLAVTVLGIAQRNPESEYFDTIVGVILIVTIGRYMDLLSRRNASNTFAGLYSLLDETSTVKLLHHKNNSAHDGDGNNTPDTTATTSRRVPAHALRAGDEILIDAFSVVPVDSYVTLGTSHVNEAVITGESLPVTKDVGSLLLAGTRNGPSPLRATVHQDDSSSSFLGQLVRSVESSLTNKAAAQRHVDAITRWFVTVILVLAAGASGRVFWRGVTAGAAAGDDVYAAAAEMAGRTMMTILSAACPCALGLATPCAVMAGIDVAWRKGILMLQGGTTMEDLKAITRVVMDKTGTLTRGSLTVRHMSIAPSWSGRERDLAVLICAAEEKGMASHPLAMAVFRRLLPLCNNGERDNKDDEKSGGSSSSPWRAYQELGGVRGLEEVGGRGIRCEVNRGDEPWRAVCVGNLAFMLENSVKGVGDIPRHGGEEGSVMFASVDGVLAASMVLQDEPRPDAKQTIKALQDRGIQVSMLTGDNAAEACRIGQMLSIPVEASCATPEDKLAHIRQLQERGDKVLMMGDGMNDGPSLAAADVGVMMAHGRKCLSSGGSVLILQSRLEALLALLDISRSTVNQVNINIAWALAYNIVAVGLAMGLGEPWNITISPPVAATMMSVSSTFITIQGLILRARLSSRHGLSE